MKQLKKLAGKGKSKEKEKKKENDAAPDPSTPTEESTQPTPQILRGMKVVVPNDDAAVDIICVHGLTGDSEKTWTTGSTNWIRDFLPQAVPSARVIAYGYDADPAHIGPFNTASAEGITNHAINLIKHAEGKREECAKRPIIFIAHSMGGLLVKEALRLSKGKPRPHERNIFQYTKGVVFMGTPHKGSWWANWADIPVRALGFFKSTNKKLLDALKTDTDYLDSLGIGFNDMLIESGRHPESNNRTIGTLEVVCLWEAKPLPGFGHVVPQANALIDGHEQGSINANHINMVKFSTMEDDGFTQVRIPIRRWVKELEQIGDGVKAGQKLLPPPPAKKDGEMDWANLQTI